MTLELVSTEELGAEDQDLKEKLEVLNNTFRRQRHNFSKAEQLKLVDEIIHMLIFHDPEHRIRP